MSYLTSNLETLKSIHVPISVSVIEEIERLDGKHYHVFPASVTGKLSLKYFDGNRSILLHSAYDPEKEAEKLIGSSSMDSDVIFVFGFGFAYHIRALQKSIGPQVRVVVLESDLNLLRVAFEQMDFRDILTDSRFIYLFGTEEMLRLQMAHLLQARTGLILHRPSIVPLLPMEKIHPGYVENLANIYRLAGLNVWKFIGNSPEDSIQGIRQTLQNIEFISKSPNIEELFGKFEGVPAICVAAGPSLQRNMHLLHKVKDKALIFACDAVYHKLIAEGITPHFVCVVERGEITYQAFFENKMLSDESILVGLNVIWPEIFRTYPGVRTVIGRSTTPFEKIVNQGYPNFALLKVGPSVAHQCFSLARSMGCDPIVLIGQDLAYSEDGESHAPGVFQWDQNEKTRQMKVGLNTEKVVFVESVNGNKIRSNEIWVQFLEWFEVEIPKTKATVIDATEGGAKIAGTEIRRLAEVIKDWKPDPRIASTFNQWITHVDEHTVEQRNQEFVRLIRKELDSLEKLDEKLQSLRLIAKGCETSIILREYGKLKEQLIEFEDHFDKMIGINLIYTFCIQYHVYRHLEFSNKEQFNAPDELIHLREYLRNITNRLIEVKDLLQREYESFLENARPLK